MDKNDKIIEGLFLQPTVKNKLSKAFKKIHPDYWLLCIKTRLKLWNIGEE